MTDRERLELIIKETSNGNAKQFAESVKPQGTVQWVYDILSEKKSSKGNAVGVSKEISLLICKAHPQYNISWVCFGLGNKLIDVDGKKSKGDNFSLEEFYILQRETIAKVHVLQEFQVWLAKETYKIPEKKIFGKLDSIRHDYEESLR